MIKIIIIDFDISLIRDTEDYEHALDNPNEYIGCIISRLEKEGISYVGSIEKGITKELLGPILDEIAIQMKNHKEGSAQWNEGAQLLGKLLTSVK